MPNETRTIGRAIDEILAALNDLDEPTRIVAVKAACEHLHIPVAPPNAAATLPGGFIQPPPQLPPTEAPGAPALDIRSLREQKNPTTAFEMACVVAYYLQTIAPEGERKNTMQASDIERYFVQGNYQLPKRSTQLLPDAKIAGYFDSIGRGTYRLNAVGHNLVVHQLPRQGTSTAPRAVGRRGATKKRRTSRKAARRAK